MSTAVVSASALAHVAYHLINAASGANKIPAIIRDIEALSAVNTRAYATEYPKAKPVAPVTAHQLLDEMGRLRSPTPLSAEKALLS